MPFDSRRLATGENPPDRFSQYLANTLPSWTAARMYGLPNQITSLTPPGSGADPNVYGSTWQNFVNPFAIELENISRTIDENLLEFFLDPAGYSHTSLDVSYRVIIPSKNITVLSVGANITPITLPNSEILDPARGTQVELIEVTRLFDYVYGYSQITSFTASSIGNVAFTLPSRVGVNADGSQAIQWVTINGTPTTSFALAADLRTITVPVSNPGQVISVHFTTYDLYYILQEDLPVLYLRYPYFEIVVATSGGNLTGTNLPDGIAVTPELHMVWNELDELGLYLNRPRRINEFNYIYQRRLVDSVLYPADSTSRGLRNALATEFDLVEHHKWGPLGDFNAQDISIGDTIDADSILINKLPLPYYSVKTTQGSSGMIPLVVQNLNIGQTVQVELQLIANGPIIPRVVPLNFSTTLPNNAQPVYNQITVNKRPRLRYSVNDIDQNNITSLSVCWYPGSLRLWKNGLPLTAGVDYIEQSTTVFTLTNLPQPGDTIQLGYIYENSLAPPELEAQADIVTDLSPIVRIGATFNVDPTLNGTLAFTGFNSLPPNTDLATIPTNSTFTVVFTITNAGSYPSNGFTINVALPPRVQFNGEFLAALDVLTQTYDLRYIDNNTVSVSSLTEASAQAKLYDRQGRATPLLAALAEEISTASPLEWGTIKWDQSIWHTANEPTTTFGYVPHVYDPTYNLTPTPTPGAFAPISQVFVPGTLAPSNFSSTLSSTFISNPPAVELSLDYTNPGTVIGNSPLIRYDQFKSGIGNGEDCQLSIATIEQLNEVAPISQDILNGTNQIIPIPVNEDQWWAALKPGTFFLNQEEHYVCAFPISVEAYGLSATLSNCNEFTALIAKAYDSVNNAWIPLRRVNLTDSAGNPTLTYIENIKSDGSGTLITSFANIDDANFIVASNVQNYTVSESALNNVLTVTPIPPAGTILRVSYTLSNAYTFLYDSSTGTATLTFDQAYPGGILATYDVGSDVFVSALPLHPYYNPRTDGFVYLKSCTQVPQKIQVEAQPVNCIANGTATVSISVLLVDGDGAGIAGQSVNVLVGYSTGAVTYSLTTDEFGYGRVRIPSSTTKQVIPVTASLQLYNANNNAAIALIDQTNVEFYVPFQ